ncbi:MAG TPA: rhodanese-like domain-containing protein [Candidatus Goldiibacteriota bacterium]|nr:rhodanese-like domain-containing protein [Candidatus Goldiibacteriota bacterium]
MIVIALIIAVSALAAGIAATKSRDNFLKNSNVSSSVSQEYITITDTETGRTSQMKVNPASAGSVELSAQQAASSAPATRDEKIAASAVKSAEAAKTGNYSYLFDPIPSKDAIHHIDIEEAKYLFDSGKAVFVDARGLSEYRESHIRGAVSIPTSATPEEIAALKSKLNNKVLVTYCHGVGCHLSDKVAYKLYDEGYRKIAIFFSGWPKWQEHKYPVSSN